MTELTGILKLQLLDVYENRITDWIDIRLRHQVLSHTIVLRNLDASKRIAIRGLHAIPQGLYRIEVDPPSYLPMSEFINVQSGPAGTQRDLVFPIDPKKIVSVTFPTYAELPDDARRILDVSASVLRFEGKQGAELHGAFDDIRRAGLLNIRVPPSLYIYRYTARVPRDRFLAFEGEGMTWMRQPSWQGIALFSVHMEFWRSTGRQTGNNCENVTGQPPKFLTNTATVTVAPGALNSIQYSLTIG